MHIWDSRKKYGEEERRESEEKGEGGGSCERMYGKEEIRRKRKIQGRANEKKLVAG